MGTINYHTSNYITIGLPSINYEDYEDANGYYNYELMRMDEEDAKKIIQTILDKYDFYYFHVAIEIGYYEGFSIDIENNYSICFDSWEDKRNAQKEITQLKLFLLECINNGMVRVSPGWCTTEYNREDSIKAIKDAIKEIREEIRGIPTYNQYYKSGELYF